MTAILDHGSDWSASLHTVYREHVVDGEIRVRPVTDEIDACMMWYKDDRAVGRYETDMVEVLTSFMGLRYGDAVPPLVYETLAQSLDGERKWRYATRKEAKEKHDAVVKLLEAGMKLTEIE